MCLVPSFYPKAFPTLAHTFLGPVCGHSNSEQTWVHMHTTDWPVVHIHLRQQRVQVIRDQMLLGLLCQYLITCQPYKLIGQHIQVHGTAHIQCTHGLYMYLTFYMQHINVHIHVRSYIHMARRMTVNFKAPRDRVFEAPWTWHTHRLLCILPACQSRHSYLSWRSDENIVLPYDWPTSFITKLVHPTICPHLNVSM